MIKKIKSGLNYVIDIYRIAPFGETLTLLNAGQIPFNYNKPLYVSLNLIGTLIGCSLIKKQFNLKKRLEQSISKYGYTNRIFKTTLPEWCDRQVARVVTRKSGNLDDYINLCESNKNKLFLSNLIHF